MSANRGPERTSVVLTLNDASTRIFGSECNKLLATSDLGTVEVTVGINGKTAKEAFDGVEGVSFEGNVSRFLRQQADGRLTLEYPNRLARLEYLLSEGRLAVQFIDDNQPTLEEEVKVLIVE